MLGPLRNAWWRVKASGTSGSVWERLATFGGVSQGLGASGSAWQRLGRSGSVRKRPEDGYGTAWENALYVKIKGSRFIRKIHTLGHLEIPKLIFGPNFGREQNCSRPL